MQLAWSAPQPAIMTTLCLPCALRRIWYASFHCQHHTLADCFDKPPYELYMRQPLRTSRVLEAAMRTAQQHLPLNTDPSGHMQLVHLILGAYHAAAEATSPEGAFPGAELLQNKRLATRSCSQIVSSLKALGQPMPPGIDQQEVISYVIRTAASIAVMGPTVHSWGIGEYLDSGGKGHRSNCSVLRGCVQVVRAQCSDV